MKICFACPTRKRPANIIRFVSSAFKNADNPDNILFAFYIDSDDEQSLLAIELIKKKFPVGSINTVVGPRITLSETHNRAYKAFKDQCEIAFYCGDDLTMNTPGYDKMIIDKFRSIPDRIALVYGDDLLNYSGVATHGFVHRNWVDTLGYIFPGTYESDWVDQHISDVASIIQRKFCLPFVNEHHHYSNGKSVADDVVREKCAKGMKQNTGAFYQSDIMRLMRINEADKLLTFMKGFAK